MYSGRLIFPQLVDSLPMHHFRRCVNRCGGNRYMKSLSCSEQFLCMAFAQFSYRKSLPKIESCSQTMHNKLYHIVLQDVIKL